jgi:hypothetical protein
MSRRQMSAFIDALAAGRRPAGFQPGLEDAAALRTAIELRAARPGDAGPDEQFVSRLYDELVELHQSRVTPILRQVHRPRRRIALVSIAAGLALVAGTVATTEAIDHPASTRVALPLPQGRELRTGTFEDASGHNLGQIVVYSGNPSWVFMDVKGSSYDGPVACSLQGANGSTVMTGGFNLEGGAGELAKTIRVNVGRLRGARLVTSTGALLASASFS